MGGSTDSTRPRVINAKIAAFIKSYYYSTLQNQIEQGRVENIRRIRSRNHRGITI